MLTLYSIAPTICCRLGRSIQSQKVSIRTILQGYQAPHDLFDGPLPELEEAEDNKDEDAATDELAKELFYDPLMDIKVLEAEDAPMDGLAKVLFYDPLMDIEASEEEGGLGGGHAMPPASQPPLHSDQAQQKKRYQRDQWRKRAEFQETGDTKAKGVAWKKCRLEAAHEAAVQLSLDIASDIYVTKAAWTAKQLENMPRCEYHQEELIEEGMEHFPWEGRLTIC
ncbi:hypothetical protein APHAL10511_000883 [Amanita phalloides]|nr:hypothetical protein APHAL10511_000883 [Amanita phalloides]